MRLRPITLRKARAFIAAHHRHNVPPRGWRFGVGLEEDGELVGVAVGGRPVSPTLDDGLTLEVTRVCTLGQKNASTMLYGAVCRAAKALGYERIVTYTLDSESGISLRAAGFTETNRSSDARHWGRPTRPSYEKTLWGNRIVPEGVQIRWERAA